MRALNPSHAFLPVLLVAALAGCASGPRTDTAGQYVDDSTITAKVKTQLASDAGLSSASAIHVETHQGVVQLSGFVDSKDQEHRAVTIARNVAGVRSVDDSIALK